MSSLRKVIANRRNSTRSTGPRTSAGKSRSSRNAFVHGLATRLIEDPAANGEIEKLATMLVAGRFGLDDLARARDVVESELELRRVRNARANLINLELGQGKDEAQAVSKTLSRISRLERYERRAYSRRKAIFRGL